MQQQITTAFNLNNILYGEEKVLWEFLPDAAIAG